MGKICCVTGHREIPEDQTEKVKAALEREIKKAAADGYTGFMTGFEEGVDRFFAEKVAEIQKSRPGMELIAVLPYPQMTEELKAEAYTKELLASCTEIKIMDGKNRQEGYSLRRRFMVEQADCVIAVYDGREAGGTVKMIRLAHQQRKELREIPMGEFHLPWRLQREK